MVTVGAVLSSVKVAVTNLSASIMTTQGSTPEQTPPDQPAKKEPVVAVAVSVTSGSDKVLVQVELQLILGGVMFTVPLPSMVTVSKKPSANAGDILVSMSTIAMIREVDLRKFFI
jgi:hypothetical protein